MNIEAWHLTVAVWLSLRGEGVLLYRERPAEPLPVEACPGCGCMPGDGRTPHCSHPDGCGYQY